MSPRKPKAKGPLHEDAHPEGPRKGRLGRIDDRILSAFAEVEAGTPADRALRAMFAKARDLGTTERQIVSDTVFGMLRHRRSLDDLLERAAKNERKKLAILEAPIRNRLRRLAFEAMRGADVDSLRECDDYAFARIPGLFERMARGQLARPERTPEAELAIRTSLPDWLAHRLIDALGLARATEIATALALRAPITLRVNRLRATRDAIREELKEAHEIEAEPTAISPDGLLLPKAVDLPSWPCFRSGAVELMDEGSQIVALATGIRPKERVLDACAGAGGKALAFAAMMENDGEIVALDPEVRHLEAARERVARAGATCTEVQRGDLLELGSSLLGRFDCVVVDSPCSGTGTLRRSPDLKWRLTEKDIASLASLEKRLLGSAARAVRPGGRLVYATCSVLFEENEAVVTEVLATEPRLRPRPLAGLLAPEIASGLGLSGRDTHMTRIGPGPSERGPDGFFVAVLERTTSP